MIDILLLDDNPQKIKKIKEVILENKILRDENITIAVCANDARRALYTNEFDLFISDLLVPANFEDEPNAEESVSLLYDINNDDNMSKPANIIGLSAYEDKIEEFQEYFTNDSWTLASYNDAAHGWENLLKNKIRYIINRKKYNNQTNQHIYDIAIICALENPEFQQIKNLSTNWTPISRKSSSIQFYETSFTRDGKELSVIAASINQMGMVPTSILATQMIELFRPKYIAMTGIAAGIAGATELGEILVVEYSWDYNSGKIATDNSGNKKFNVDIRQEALDRDLYNRMNTLKDDKDFLYKLYNSFKGTKPKTYLEISIGHIASGAAVIANNNIIENITLQARKLKGIEMEAYGLFCAAHYATNPKPKPLVIKSVCDFANEDKNDDIQEYAAYTSAQVLYEFALRYL